MPSSDWGRAVKRLQNGIHRQLIPARHIVVVLPFYFLVTVYDSEGHRQWRRSDSFWHRRLRDITPGNDNFQALEIPEQPAFGNIAVWLLKRTRVYNGSVLRAGSTVILEEYGENALKDAASEIRETAPGVRIGIFHCGGAAP